MAHKVAIIGAGMGGLALALRLSHRGYEVDVFEKNDFVGGRNHPIKVGESWFDSGPTLLMMQDPLHKLFTDVGERIEEHLTVAMLDPCYRAWFASGRQIDATTNQTVMRQRVEQIGGTTAGREFEKLMRDVADLYEASLGPFIRQDYLDAKEWMKPKSLSMALKMGVFGNLWNEVSRRFSHDELRMLFSFQTMYLGLSPFQSPWVYSTLVHMEYGEGIGYVRGGMVELAEALAKLCRSRGCKIHYHSEVVAIESHGVRLKDGQWFASDTTVCNMDMPAAQEELLGRDVDSVRSSCGALMFYWDVKGQHDKLLHHNVFFSSDYRENFDAIFERNEHPSDPSFYVCVSSKTDPGRTAEGHENVMVLVPCPSSTHAFEPKIVESYRHSVIKRLKNDVHFDPKAIEVEVVRQPSDWASQLGLFRGQAFGLGHQLGQSAMFRPKIRDASMPNLYYVGASTTPGNGIPMVLISAELVESRLVKDGRC